MGIVNLSKSDIASVLREARLSSGKTRKEVAEHIGKTIQLVGHWETGYSQPDADTLFELCAFYGTTVDSAFGFKNSHSLSPREKEHVKKYRSLDDHGKYMVDIVIDGEVARMKSESPKEIVKSVLLKLSEQPASAGTGVYLGAEAFTTLKVLDNEKTRKTAFLVPVSGDSMEPKFSDGDILMVADEIPEKGQIGIFTLDGCGYVKKRGDGVLISINPDYDDIQMDDTIIANGTVIGKLDQAWMIEQI